MRIARRVAKGVLLSFALIAVASCDLASSLLLLQGEAEFTFDEEQLAVVSGGESVLIEGWAYASDGSREEFFLADRGNGVVDAWIEGTRLGLRGVSDGETVVTCESVSGVQASILVTVLGNTDGSDSGEGDSSDGGSSGGGATGGSPTVSLSQDTLLMNPGESASVTAYPKDADGVDESLSNVSTNNPLVLSVMHSGTTIGISANAAGTADVTVTSQSGATATISVTVHDTAPVGAPEISSIDYIDTLPRGGEATITVTASDPQGDTPLQYHYEKTTTEGSLYQWYETAQLDLQGYSWFFGDVGITVTVRDSNGFETEQTITISVVNDAPIVEGAAVFTVDPATEAELEDITADPTLYPAQKVRLDLTVDEPENDTVTYDWALTDAATGSLTDAGVADIDFTTERASAFFVPATGYYGPVSVTVTMTDEFGASDTADFTLTIGDTPPTIDAVALSASEISRVDTAEITVDATDYEGEPLEYRYTVRSDGDSTGEGTIEVGGSPATDWVSSNAATFVPQVDGAIGRVDVLVEVRDAAGSIDSETVGIDLARRWSVLGDADFFSGYAGGYDFTMIDGAPYVAVENSFNDDISVFTFDGTSWVQVGDTFDAGTAATAWIEIGSWQGDPILTYQYRPTPGGTPDPREYRIYRFNGSSWVTLGKNQPVATGYADYPELVEMSGELYLIWEDGRDITMIKYDTGTDDWLDAGSAGISAVDGFGFGVTTDGSAPYVAFRDSAAGREVSVMTFDGTSWSYVGTPGFSDGENIYDPDVVVDSATGDVYAIFQEWRSTGAVTWGAGVQKWDGSSWQSVGSRIFTDLDKSTVLPDAGNDPKIELLNGRPIAVFEVAMDSGHPRADLGGKVLAMMYDGTDWVHAGQEVFTGDAGFPLIEVDAGAAYVLYETENDSLTMQVLR